MTQTKEKREQTPQGLICIDAFAVTISLFTPWHAQKLTHLCKTDAHGDAVPDRDAEGVLPYVERSYYLERAHDDNVIIDRCGGKTGCQISDSPFQHLIGEIAQTEFFYDQRF